MEIPRIKTAFSYTREAKLAAMEIYEALGRPNDGLTIFFCSPFFDLDALAGGLRDCFRYADVIGCTTAGEITSIGYVDGAICAVWLPGGDFECVTEHVENLRLGQLEEVRRLVHALLRRKRNIEDTGWNTFGICLIDGI